MMKCRVELLDRLFNDATVERGRCGSFGIRQHPRALAFAALVLRLSSRPSVVTRVDRGWTELQVALLAGHCVSASQPPSFSTRSTSPAQNHARPLALTHERSHRPTRPTSIPHNRELRAGPNAAPHVCACDGHPLVRTNMRCTDRTLAKNPDRVWEEPSCSSTRPVEI